jgi:hypothetical protein
MRNMKNQKIAGIKITVALAALILTAGCKKAPIEQPAAPQASQRSTVVVMQWAYGFPVSSTQLWYSVNGGASVTLAEAKGSTFFSNASQSVGEAAIYPSAGDVIIIGGLPLGGSPNSINMLSLTETSASFTTDASNGIVSDTVRSGGSDTKFTITGGATALSYTVH